MPVDRAFLEKLTEAAKACPQPEYFGIRGIGLDHCPCLDTGETLDGYVPNISGLVKSKEAGERVVAMFGGRARLDFRDFEPNWIQVKVGITKGNEVVLRRLSLANYAMFGILDPRVVVWALDPEAAPGWSPFERITKAAESIAKFDEDEGTH